VVFLELAPVRSSLSMSTADEIAERVRALPASLQEEALHYVEYLLERKKLDQERQAWAHACAASLAAAYGPDDSVYDSP
jgi:hypothetical protein